MIYKKGSEGFTLAEVLITLAIIGIVAALTIPSLIQNVQNEQLKTAFKKEYSVLSQATNELINDKGGSFEGLCATGTGDHDCFQNIYLPYLNYTKSCTGDTSIGNCWPSSYTTLEGQAPAEYSNKSGLILSDGSMLRFWKDAGGCTDVSGSITKCGWISIDVNGFKEPNRYGKDIYFVWVLKDRIVPWGTQGDDPSRICTPGDMSGSNGWGCAARYLSQ